MMIFFVYIDWTTEEVPRPFYVGKGVIGRVRKRERNAYWQNIAAKFGWRREVVYGTKDETHAFEVEKKWIADLGTFEKSEHGMWGANLTEGGGGVSGWKHSSAAKLAIGRNNPMKNEASVAKVAAAQRAKGPNHHARTAEFRARVSKSKSGEKHHAAQLTWENVKFIRSTLLKTRELAVMFGVSRRVITNARSGITWKLETIIGTRATLKPCEDQ